MREQVCSILQSNTKEHVQNLHNLYLKLGLTLDELEKETLPEQDASKKGKKPLVLFISLIILLSSVLYKCNVLNYLYGVRCIVPNNYFIWEATRPISDCTFCSNVTEPIILPNLTRQEFEPYAYSSKPIIVRGAFRHWPAVTQFSWRFFKELYDSVDESYRSVDEECQFLHFKSDFISIQDVFAMSEARVKNSPGEKSWYVGWGNCHPAILQEMRRFYPKPHFLPDDTEIPHKEYIFMGYDDGATMHLDFINRLMWQAQLQGSKLWNLLPPPECQNVCRPVKFIIHPGDAVLVDTRIWYHATTIPDGEFSLSVQSEYG